MAAVRGRMIYSTRGVEQDGLSEGTHCGRLRRAVGSQDLVISPSSLVAVPRGA